MPVDLSFGRYDGRDTTHVIFVLYLDDATFIFQDIFSALLLLLLLLLLHHHHHHHRDSVKIPP
jgi:hypothetical protein